MERGMNQSQPETELNDDVSSDEAVLEQLARKREEPAAEGADAEEQEEVEATPEEAEPEAEQVEEDPEFDLGDLKAKKSEILAWKSGQMKEADYRRKTAEAAEAKREAQAQQERVTQERSHYANQLDVLIGQLQTELVGDQQVLAQMANDDPIEWVRHNATMQQKIQRFQQAIGERQVIEQRAQQEQERKRQDWVNQQSQALQEKLPEWKDPAVRTKELGEMEAFLRAQGYSDGDMAAFLDHRVYLLARKAWQADKQATARVTAKDKQIKPPPPKALKPGPAQNDKAESDAYKEALRRAKSGKEDDLMALMAAKRRNA
jgi:hypothetical protein